MSGIGAGSVNAAGLTLTLTAALACPPVFRLAAAALLLREGVLPPEAEGGRRRQRHGRRQRALLTSDALQALGTALRRTGVSLRPLDMSRD